MTLVVRKYGGTSVGSPERIREVARSVAAARRAGHDLVVVVSAMGDATDDLIALAEAVTGNGECAARHPRETDMLLTAGERISMALLAMAIREAGAEAVSLTGSQAAIITDDVHTAARITEVRADRVRDALARDRVAIVAGFQGVSRGREVTTLGRGGSDTTAVALAAALGAGRCEIYTDVRGIFTADPRLVPGARRIPELSFDEMLELAAGGAQVMHARAVEIAWRFGIDLRIRSSFDPDTPDAPGTLVTRTPRRMEELVLTGLASQPGWATIVVSGLPAGMRTATAVLVALAEGGVSVDMINEARESDDRAQLQISVAEPQLAEGMRICEALARAMGGAAVTRQSGLTRIALVGSGMNRRPGVYARAFRALLDEEIEVLAVSTSGISISLLVPTDRGDDALRALHAAFELELVPGVAAGGS